MDAVTTLSTHSPNQLHSAHVILTGGLFIINLLLTSLITSGSFVGRLRYVGHEMAFLAIGLVAARLFFDKDLLVLIISLVLYIAVWIITLLLTKQVMDRDDRLYPQIVFSLITGCFSVYFAAAGYVEQAVLTALS
jgi:hypothetical protein